VQDVGAEGRSDGRRVSGDVDGSGSARRVSERVQGVSAEEGDAEVATPVRASPRARATPRLQVYEQVRGSELESASVRRRRGERGSIEPGPESVPAHTPEVELPDEDEDVVEADGGVRINQ